MSADSFSSLVGQELLSVQGLHRGSEKVEFITQSGRKFVMRHQQDCCEHVSIEDVCGDVEDLIGHTIVNAVETSSTAASRFDESATWTFYTIQSVRGAVTIRWLGTSNGYYSESVDFFEDSN